MTGRVARMRKCEIHAAFYSQNLWGRCRYENIVEMYLKLPVGVLTGFDWGGQCLNASPAKGRNFLTSLATVVFSAGIVLQEITCTLRHGATRYTKLRAQQDTVQLDTPNYVHTKTRCN
jgi:hypothetical protein